HYPGFQFIAPDRYPAFQTFHMTRITWIVLPVMLVELVSALFLYYYLPEPVWTINLILLLLIWCSTICIQSPLHGRLTKGFDAALIHELIRGNWIRTLLWSVRALVLLTHVAPGDNYYILAQPGI